MNKLSFEYPGKQAENKKTSVNCAARLPDTSSLESGFELTNYVESIAKMQLGGGIPGLCQ